MAGEPDGIAENRALTSLVQALGRYGLDVETHPAAESARPRDPAVQ